MDGPQPSQGTMLSLHPCLWCTGVPQPCLLRSHSKMALLGAPQGCGHFIQTFLLLLFMLHSESLVKARPAEAGAQLQLFSLYVASKHAGLFLQVREQGARQLCHIPSWTTKGKEEWVEVLTPLDPKSAGEWQSRAGLPRRSHEQGLLILSVVLTTATA